METIEIDGATLAYEVEGTGPHTLAFVHGWCSKAAHWDAQAERFRSTYRVVRWDRRGMGRSRGGAAASGPQRHVSDLVAILDRSGIERTVVVGHAGGGPTAVTFAARQSERTEALVMIDTRLHSPAPAGEVDRWAAGLERSCTSLREVGDEYFRGLYASFFGHRAAPAIVEDAIASALATPVEVAAAELMHMAGDTAGLAAEVRCPVLWISAHPEDTAAVQRCFADVTVGHVVGSGHFPQVEVPDQLNPMLAAFLEDRLEAPAARRDPAS